jgi:acyl carrier protein
LGPQAQDRRTDDHGALPQQLTTGAEVYRAAKMDREAQIRKVIAVVAKRPVDVDLDESLFESGFLDSFALVTLVSGLENEFGIKIPDSDLIPQRFDSISRIDRYLAGFLKN